MDLEITQFIKEKLTKEFEAIEIKLKDEQVEISINPGLLKYSGTKKGIEKAMKRTKKLKNEIRVKKRSYSSPGILKLFFNEDGQRNLKSIEVQTNVILRVTDSNKEIIQKLDIEGIRSERIRFGKDSAVPQKPSDPYDVCNFNTKEGLTVSWKYGDLAKEKASIILICVMC